MVVDDHGLRDDEGRGEEERSFGRRKHLLLSCCSTSTNDCESNGYLLQYGYS